jgi:hypothetical protein
MHSGPGETDCNQLGSLIRMSYQVGTLVEVIFYMHYNRQPVLHWISMQA